MTNFMSCPPRIQKMNPYQRWSDERLGVKGLSRASSSPRINRAIIPGQFDDVEEPQFYKKKESNASTSSEVGDLNTQPQIQVSVTGQFDDAEESFTREQEYSGVSTATKSQQSSCIDTKSIESVNRSMVPERSAAKRSLPSSGHRQQRPFKKRKRPTPPSSQIIDLTDDTNSEVEQDETETQSKVSAGQAVSDKRSESAPLSRKTRKEVVNYMNQRSEYLELVYKMIVMRNSGISPQIQKSLVILTSSFSIPHGILPIEKESFVHPGPNMTIQSRFVGVSWGGKDGWKACVSYYGVTYSLGKFLLEKKAACTHVWALQFLNGEWSPPIPPKVALLPIMHPRTIKDTALSSSTHDDKLTTIQHSAKANKSAPQPRLSQEDKERTSQLSLLIPRPPVTVSPENGDRLVPKLRPSRSSPLPSHPSPTSQSPPSKSSALNSPRRKKAAVSQASGKLPSFSSQDGEAGRAPPRASGVAQKLIEPPPCPTKSPPPRKVNCASTMDTSAPTNDDALSQTKTNAESINQKIVSSAEAWAKIRHPSPLLDPTSVENTTKLNRLYLLRKDLVKNKSRSTDVSFVNRHDVVIARGRRIENAWFDDLITKYLKQYNGLPTGFRRKFAVNLLYYIELCGGRFLLESHKGTPNFPTVYLEAGDVPAVEKIMRCLREKGHELTLGSKRVHISGCKDDDAEMASKKVKSSRQRSFDSVDQRPVVPANSRIVENVAVASKTKRHVNSVIEDQSKAIVSARINGPAGSKQLPSKSSSRGYFATKEQSSCTELQHLPAKDTNETNPGFEQINSLEAPFLLAHRDLHETSRGKRKEKRLPHYLLF